ncbi:MAG TPA: isoprenylcysteine carboxylmethyltransferase family protein [Phenylobacterium sp.]
MGKVLAVAYGVVCYVIFFATFLYAIGFVDGLVVPKDVDTGAAGPLIPTLVINGALLAIFAVQHSVMARPGFKAWWTKIVPASVERSTYVLLASLALILMFWQWRPLPATVWSVTGPAATALWVLNAIGWAVLLTSTFLISHFDLFGLNQVWAYATGKPAPAKPFHTPLFYRYVRHPLYLGFMIGFWAAPTMSQGHLLFAIGATGYILVGIFFEERDLVAAFGDTYRGYQKRVSMLLPWIPKAGA